MFRKVFRWQRDKGDPIPGRLPDGSSRQEPHEGIGSQLVTRAHPEIFQIRVPDYSPLRDLWDEAYSKLGIETRGRKP
jgi:hypothetical protein